MKLLIISDLHLRKTSEDVLFNQVFPGVEEMLKSTGASAVVILGDVFHIRYEVDIRLFNRLHDLLTKWGSPSDTIVETIIIPGNHDQYALSGRHALEAFDLIPGVTVYTEPTWNRLGLWVPYRKSLEEVREGMALKMPDDLAAARVLWMHHGFAGAFMNNYKVNEDGLLPGEMKGWDVVFTGHYHKHQELEGAAPIVYIGTPYQTKADETNQEKGVILWDTETFEYEFIPKVWGPRYHKIQVQADGSMDTSNVQPGDIVNVIAAPGSDAEAITKSLEGANVTVSLEVEPIEQRLAVAQGATLRDYALAYVDLKGEESGLDVSRLTAEFDKYTALEG